ncbi:MAG: FG-GAP-like repeat-containing protein [candidate division WOR-3 bacterium]
MKRIRYGRAAALSLLLGGTMATALAQLSYVESSAGLIPPTMESGKTELEFADVNNDGNVDLLSIGDHGSPYVNTDQHGVMVWFGDGQGNWSVFMSGDFGYGGIAVGDVNNDGLLDVGYGMHHNYSGVPFGDQLIEAALGDGTGRNWTPWDSGLATNGETWGMFGTDFADFDSDGWLDLVSNSFGGSAGVHVYLNQRTGYWVQSFGFVGGLSKNEVTTGDIDNDGDIDFVVGHQYGSVYLNDGTGRFVLTDRNLPPGESQGRLGVALGDVDNDGAQEFSFVNATGGVGVWKWQAAADSWVSLSAGLPSTGVQATWLCDMDCDGYVDLVGFGNGNGVVWRGDGQGNWTQTATFSTPSPGTGRTLRAGGDVDHNGFPDVALVAVSGTRNYVRCFREASVADSLRIMPGFPRGGERLIAGSVRFIDWWSEAQNAADTRVRLELSVHGAGGPWQTIADSLRNSGRYQWTVPDCPSAQCHIRYTVFGPSGSVSCVTTRPFTIIGRTGITRPDGFGPVPEADGRLRLCPNPVTGQLVSAIGSALTGTVQVRMYDATGRCVLARLLKAARTGTLDLDLRSVTPGVYVLLFDTGRHSTVQTVVKVH